MKHQDPAIRGTVETTTEGLTRYVPNVHDRFEAEMSRWNKWAVILGTVAIMALIILVGLDHQSQTSFR